MEITVKHQNPDLGDLDQKLSDQQCRIFGQVRGGNFTVWPRMGLVQWAELSKRSVWTSDLNECFLLTSQLQKITACT